MVLRDSQSRPTGAGVASATVDDVKVPVDADIEKLREDLKRLQDEIKTLAPLVKGKPATQPDAAQRAAAVNLAKQLGELTKKQLEFSEKKVEADLLLQLPALRGPAEGMPPGSSPRQFNGFTYYIVPLGK